MELRPHQKEVLETIGRLSQRKQNILAIQRRSLMKTKYPNHSEEEFNENKIS